MLKPAEKGSVKILPGVFRERMDVNRQYLLELDANCLLQNFYLEAGIILPGLQVVDNPETATSTGAGKPPPASSADTSSGTG